MSAKFEYRLLEAIRQPDGTVVGKGETMKLTAEQAANREGCVVLLSDEIADEGDGGKAEITELKKQLTSAKGEITKLTNANKELSAKCKTLEANPAGKVVEIGKAAKAGTVGKIPTAPAAKPK